MNFVVYFVVVNMPLKILVGKSFTIDLLLRLFSLAVHVFTMIKLIAIISVCIFAETLKIWGSDNALVFPIQYLQV